MKRQRILIGALVLGLLLALAVGLSQAQEPEPPAREVGAEGDVGAAAAVENIIPIQGRLTDASGNPLDGTYNITFRLYDVSSGGTPLFPYTTDVVVTDGLFTAYMGYCAVSNIDGRPLYLGIEVEGDGEMMPRQPILPVPYAFSLIPGAIISDTRDGVLTVRSTGSGDSDALYAYAEGTGEAVTGEATDGIGVYGTSVNGNGVYGSSANGNGVYGFTDSSSGVFGGSFVGIGVTGLSLTGPAISAEGSGVIQSTAKSYLWISGNGVRPYQQSDTTVIDMDTVGGALIYRGVIAGNKNVMLPITVVGPLYGQDVTISDLDIYWKGNTTSEAITAVLLRRQTGVCSSASCYASIIQDVGGAGYTCEDAANPEGCTLHYDTTSNNVLTADSGILYLTLELSFSNSSAWVEIGGVRLTLEHD